MGAAQPLEGKKLDPPQSGPPPQNPPFMGGSAVHKAILGCWAAAAIVSAIMPVVARNLTPPSGAVVSAPLFKKTNFEIYRAWDPPVLAPIVARNLTPPSGPAFVPPISSVVFDSKSTGQITGLGVSTFTDSTLLTVGNNPNRALVVQISLSTAPVTFSCSWDGQAMTQLALILDTGINNTTVLFGLLNPNPGTKTLTGSWSNSSDFIVEATSLYNVDQTSIAKAFPNVATAQGTVSPNSVAVASAPGNMVIAAHTAGDFATTFTATNNTTLFTNSVTHICAAGNIAAGAASITSTATQAVDKPWTSAAVDVQAVRTLPSRWPQEATIAAWAPLYQAPIVGSRLPPQPAAVAAFPFRGSFVPAEVLAAWTPAPFFQIVQELLILPIPGPQNPPLTGAQVPQAVLNAWISPPPAPIIARNLASPLLTYPTTGIFSPSNPVFANDTTSDTSFRVLAVLSGKSTGKVQVSFVASTAAALTVNHCSIAKWDGTNAPSATTVPVELKFGGASGFSLAAGGSIVSDLTDHSGSFSLAAGDTAIVVADVSASFGGTSFSSANTNADSWFLATTPTWNVQSPGGFTKLAGLDYLVAKIETSGLLYNPIGSAVPAPVQIAWQPLPPAPITAVNLIPPSGPAASNPPFNGGAKIPQAILNAWIPPAPMPIAAQNLTPPSAPVVTFVPPARFLTEILNSWIAAPVAPIVADNLNPPISGPAATNPPFTGALVPVTSLEDWSATIILARNLTPPSGASGFLVPGARVPVEVLINWLPPAPMPIVAVHLNPPQSGPAATNPPFPGSQIPEAELVAWLPPAPMPIVARNLNPPIGVVAPSNPPFPGTSVPIAVLDAWIPPAPMPVVAINLNPPISGPLATNPPFTGALVPIVSSDEWAPIVARNLTPPSAPPSLPGGGGARVPGEVLINWLPPTPMPVVARNLTPPSGPAADNPPFNGGTRVKLEIQLAWIAALPGYPPLKAINKTPPSGGAVAPPVLHAKPFFVSFGLRPL